MRLTLKKLIMSLFAGFILLPGVSKIKADAQYVYWRRPVRIIVIRQYSPVVRLHFRVVRPYYPVVQPYYPVYYPVYDPYPLPTYGAVEPFPYLQEKGYKEGVDEGKDDAEDGRLPNPTIHKDFYKSYSPVYRQAFIQGYYDAYRIKIIN
jgi:hypothetical protein